MYQCKSCKAGFFTKEGLQDHDGFCIGYYPGGIFGWLKNAVSVVKLIYQDLV